MRVVGVVIRLRHHGDDLAGAHVENDPGCGQRLEFGAGGDQLVAQRMLNAQIDGKLHRGLQPVGGKPRHVQRGEPVAVQPLLHAGDALIVGIDVADQMRDLGAVRVAALVFAEKADARQALPVDFPLLLGRDVTLEPHEAALGGQPLAQLGGIDIGQVRGEQFHRLVDIDEPARLAVERGHAHVGGQNLAAPIEDVRTRRRDRVAGDDAVHGTAVGCDRKHDEAGGNDGIDHGEGENRQADPRPRLGAAIDLVAVEQRAHQPPPPEFAGLQRCGLGDRGHRSAIRICGHLRARFAGGFSGSGGRRRDASRHRVGLLQILDHDADRIRLSDLMNCGGRSGS